MITPDQADFLLQASDRLTDNNLSQAVKLLIGKSLDNKLTSKEEGILENSAIILMAASKFPNSKTVERKRRDFVGDINLLKERVAPEIGGLVFKLNKSMDLYFKKVYKFLELLSKNTEHDYTEDLKYPGPITSEDIISEISVEKKTEESRIGEHLKALEKSSEDYISICVDLGKDYVVRHMVPEAIEEFSDNLTGKSGGVEPLDSDEKKKIAKIVKQDIYNSTEGSETVRYIEVLLGLNDTNQSDALKEIYVAYPKIYEELREILARIPAGPMSLEEMLEHKIGKAYGMLESESKESEESEEYDNGSTPSDEKNQIENENNDDDTGDSEQEEGPRTGDY